MSKKRRTGVYWVSGMVVIALSIAGGWLLSSSLVEPEYDQPADISTSLVDEYFNQGLDFMLKEQYPQAVESWRKLLLINEKIPEAHVNLGFSLFELKQYLAASQHFQRAMDINAYQANAYYGLAICYEQLGDIGGALGAMRSFIHLAKEDDPYLRKANSAIWEWESALQSSRSEQASPAAGKQGDP